MTPADPHFQAWFRHWQRQQAGVGTLHDFIMARMNWELSLALQLRLGALD